MAEVEDYERTLLHSPTSTISEVGICQTKCKGRGSYWEKEAGPYTSKKRLGRETLKPCDLFCQRCSHQFLTHQIWAEANFSHYQQVSNLGETRGTPESSA